VSDTAWAVLGVLAGWGAIVLWRRRREGPAREAWKPPRLPDKRSDDGIDRAELEAAEREVTDLGTDVKGRPLEDAVGDDWGPGTPKPPYV